MTEGTATDRPEAADVRESEPSGWWARHTSVATRLTIGILVISVVSLVASVVIAVTGSGNEGEDLLQLRINSTMGERATELNAYLGRIGRSMRVLGSDRRAIDGVQEFAAAYAELDQASIDDLEVEVADLTTFYYDEFLPILEDVRGVSVDPLVVASGLNPAAVYLQAAYLAQNPFPIDEKRLLTDAEDGSAWTDIHKRVHRDFRADADRLGFADLYLIEPEQRTIVYSTDKRADFGTSLDSGPHSGTKLARAVTAALTSGEPAAVVGEDFSTYTPRFDEPTAFAATPLFDGDTLVGVLAASLSNDDIDKIMFRDVGGDRLGETGEIYLVGQDARMRSRSRAFVADPSAYLARVDEIAAATAGEQSQMRALNTTVLFQEVDTTAVRSLLQGNSGVVEGTNYLGEEVYSAFQPLDAELFGWSIVVEQERSEVDAPVTEYVRGNVLLTSVIVVALTFFAGAWAAVFVRPLGMMTAALQRIQDGSVDIAIPSSGATEFRALSRDLNAMVADLAGRRQAVSNALSKKTGVLLALLPPSVADAVVGGNRRLVETVRQASVVVLVFRGLDESLLTTGTEANRDLMHSIVDAADAIAAVTGLERIKVMGDTYYAACGVDTPYLDHAPRSVQFAVAVRAEIQALARDHDLDLDVSAGVNVGPITVGLTGNSRLIYDLWGDTAERAVALSGLGAPGEILVTDAVRDRLPGGTQLTRFHSEQVSAWVVLPPDTEEGPSA